MIQALPYGGFENVTLTLEVILATEDSKIGYFVDLDLGKTDATKNRTHYFPICPEPNKS